MSPRPGLALPASLIEEIRDCGYFPELIADAISLARGAEPVEAHLVHHEATFSQEEIQRHLTVLILTPTRLVVGHTDENAAPGEPMRAITTTESVPVAGLRSVALSQVVDHPESYGTRKSKVVEAWLTIGWGTTRRIELEPAQCGDPNCEADHGYSGDLAADDLTVRISATADGEAKVRELVEFATTLQIASGTR